MKLLLAHPTGNQFFRHLGATLAERGSLGCVATCLDLSGLARGASPLLSSGIRSEMARRSFRGTWAVDIKTRPWRELGRLLAQRLQWRGGLAHEEGVFCVDAVYRDFDHWLARRLPSWRQQRTLDGVYAYEDSAFAVFTAAREMDLRRVYDLPIAYWETARSLMREEAERLPGWAATLAGGIRDSLAKLERKIKELELAELIVCPSRFVADSLPEWARRKNVVVAPFGSPPALSPELKAKSEEQRAKRAKAGKPLRVMFAGSMGQRKGLGDLFSAIKLLNRRDVELVVMGSLQAPMELYRKVLPSFIYEPGRPHNQVLDLMRSCDVLCLPSIVEGRALVMQEAMSQGLPLIITPNTGGGDLVENSRTGFLVPIRRPDMLAERIAWCADHRGETLQLGAAASDKAAIFSWEAYGETILSAIEGLATINSPCSSGWGSNDRNLK